MRYTARITALALLLFGSAAFLCTAGVAAETALSLPRGSTLSGAPGERRHLVFFQGTPEEIEVFTLFGRENGPTVMLLGGIHGNEPGAYLSADLYADLSLKKGNLIVVPRANFKSVIAGQRGPGGDMNRKFDSVGEGDPEAAVVQVLKSLMAESDALVTLHDGSGFYRPTWESDMANPGRYGQSIIADSASYHHPGTGRRIPLEEYALAALERINAAIETPLHRFHFFNMETGSPDSPHLEHKNSATFYALTRFGIPAFCIETSKQLPSMEMKVLHHNIAVNAFLEIFGVEMEYPAAVLPKPELAYLVIAVNDAPPLAVADGQTLGVASGDTIRILHTGANYGRGLSVEASGQGVLWNAGGDAGKSVTITSPLTLTVRKDSAVIGKVTIAPLEGGEKGPLLAGNGAFKRPHAATPATLDMLPGSILVAQLEAPPPPPATDPAPGTGTPSSAPATGPATPPIAGPGASGTVTGFLVAVNGKQVEIPPGGELAVAAGSKLAIVDLKSDGELPPGLVMNLKGFVPRSQETSNDGEDRGHTADTAKDLMPRFSVGGRGEVYPLNAELDNNTVLAACSIRVVTPKLEFVTVRIGGETKALKIGSRTPIPAGTKVELVGVTLRGNLALENPRYTLAGHAVPATLPQTLTMRDIAINLAIFDGDTLLGKVTWLPK